jgi:flagellar FliL protein
MSEPTPNTVDPLVLPDASDTTKRNKWLPRILIGAFIGGVALIECAAAYVLMPSGDDVSQWAQNRDQQPAAMLPEDDEEPAPDFSNEGKPAVEVELGEYGVTAYQPVSNTTLRIDFRLFGTVLDGDVSDFDKRMERNKHRVRDQVIVTVRSAEVTDFTDAGLGLLKRKILDRTNRMLGRPLIQDVMFSEFSFVEQ